MEEADELASDAVGYSIPDLYQSRLHRYVTLIMCASSLNSVSGLIYSVIAPLILFFSTITFGLLWIVFRYNLVYVTISRLNTRGLLYPTALNQLFTGIYVMELSVIGLFFLVRDEQNKAICVSQAVIMTIATALTFGFQLLLNNAIDPLLRFIPPSEMIESDKDADHDEKRETIHLWVLVQRFVKLLAPNSMINSMDGIFANTDYKSKNSGANEWVSLEFQHASLCMQKPVIWIPNDHLGISDDEIFRVRQRYSNVSVSNEHAVMDEKGRVKVTQDPGSLSRLEPMKL